MCVLEIVKVRHGTFDHFCHERNSPKSFHFLLQHAAPCCTLLHPNNCCTPTGSPCFQPRPAVAGGGGVWLKRETPDGRPGRERRAFNKGDVRPYRALMMYPRAYIPFVKAVQQTNYVPVRAPGVPPNRFGSSWTRQASTRAPGRPNRTETVGALAISFDQ